MTTPGGLTIRGLNAMEAAARWGGYVGDQPEYLGLRHEPAEGFGQLVGAYGRGTRAYHWKDTP